MTTSIRFHHRPSVREGRHPGKLFIRIIHDRRCRHILREYAVCEDEWDANTKKIIFPQNEKDADRGRRLMLIDESMKNDLKHLQEIIYSLSEGGGDYSACDVVERFKNSLNINTVCGYARITGNKLREQGRERTARAYRSAARSLTDFIGGKDICLSEIDASLIHPYEQWLIEKGLKLNTVSFYLRNIRALYYRAVAEKIIAPLSANPFAGTHTGVYETKRRALNEEQLKSLARLEDVLIEKIELLDVKSTDSDRHAEKGYVNERSAKASMDVNRKISALHDSLLYFLFCYHARGMSFVDMAHLKKSDVGSGYLTYRRRKTGGALDVKVTEPMSRILAYFAQKTEGSEYLFPVIDSRKTLSYKQYEAGLKQQNRLLKVLARMSGIAETLSTHAARHTWATLAKRLHVPVAVIGEALGHRDMKTTSIYLASFDRATMDELSVRLSETVKAA